VALLNEYFSLMVDCIQHEGGMLDKFIGDAIMAVFGTPFPHDDDPDRAVRASIAMLRELGRFNAERVSRKLMAIDMGIGLATDTIVSGNIGSPKRMDFTVIGDGVNLASRLEGACKPYKAKLLISENTQKGLRGTYRMREIDRVIVKGKTEPVAIFEVLDWHEPAKFPNMGDVLSAFRGGLDAYRAGEFVAGLRRFEEASRCVCVCLFVCARARARLCARACVRAPARVVAALSASGMAGLSLPPEPGRLTIATDGDAAGASAGIACVLPAAPAPCRPARRRWRRRRWCRRSAPGPG
jgi:hypothetical protein